VAVQEIGPSEFVGFHREDEENNSSLALILPNQAGWSTSIALGRISPAYGRVESAPTLRSAARVKLPAEIATALIAGGRANASHSAGSGQSMSSTREAAVQVYELRDDADHHAFFFARGKQPWSSGPWSSDAEVLYCRVENEKLAHFIVIGGSSAAWRGEALLNADGPFHFFEWRRRDGIISSERESISTTPAFDELTTSSNCSSPVSHPTSTYAEKR
ncbi:MAG: hypothetical protein WA213_05125, partial [Terriglobales bacterium]